MGVLITGLDGFGGELWDVDAFWWEGSRTRDYLSSRMKPDEPRPAWSARVDPGEMQTLMAMFPIRFEQHQHHADKLASSLEGTSELRITVYEWSSG